MLALEQQAGYSSIISVIMLHDFLLAWGSKSWPLSPV
jgi:hypothetical protein